MKLNTGTTIRFKEYIISENKYSIHKLSLVKQEISSICKFKLSTKLIKANLKYNIKISKKYKNFDCLKKLGLEFEFQNSFFRKSGELILKQKF